MPPRQSECALDQLIETPEANADYINHHKTMNTDQKLSNAG